MKVYQLFLNEEQQLILEFKFKNAIAAGTLGAAMMSNPSIAHQKPNIAHHNPTSHVVLPVPKPHANPAHIKTAHKIAKKYKINPEEALNIVQLAHKYEKPSFPKAKDILAIIGIESSFKPKAVSGLKRDPAVGLTQIRPKMWGLNAHDLEHNIKKQISTSSDILHLYYKKLKNRHAAVGAYNVGLGEFRSGNHAEGYVSKYMHELRDYAGT